MKSLAVEFYNQAVLLAPRIFSGVFIFAGFWLGGMILRAFIERAGRRTRIDINLIQLFSRTAHIFAIIFGLVTALGTMGVNVGALIAGLGLSGFALGFAFKDALSNLLAGISILLYRPFRRGDHISVTGVEGTVVQIDLRYTILDGGDKRILVPNSNLFVNTVTILTAPAQKAA